MNPKRKVDENTPLKVFFITSNQTFIDKDIIITPCKKWMENFQRIEMTSFNHKNEAYIISLFCFTFTQKNLKDKGIALGAMLGLESGEVILNMFSMNIDEKHPYITGVTKNGLVKKSDKNIYIGSTQNKRGFVGAGLKEGDSYIWFGETNGDYMSLITNDNMIIQFDLEKINPVGKTAKGVKGIALAENDYVIEVVVCNPAIDN